MAWIQDGGVNPWYVTFDNTALEAIFFNGVQVWASAYSFSLTVSYKVGVDGLSLSDWNPLECDTNYNEVLLSYVSRFSLSVSNVVGCDTISFYPLGLIGQLDALKFKSTGTFFEAIWRYRNDFYNIETNTDYAPDFFIDRFYFSSNTQAVVNTGYPLYDHGTYTTVSSVQSDPYLVNDWPDGDLRNANRALKYFWMTNLPGSYYYNNQMDTANYHRWSVYSVGCKIPLKITRGNISKYLYLGIDTQADNENSEQRHGTFSAYEANQSVTASKTGTFSGDW